MSYRAPRGGCPAAAVLPGFTSGRDRPQLQVHPRTRLPREPLRPGGVGLARLIEMPEPDGAPGVEDGAYADGFERDEVAQDVIVADELAGDAKRRLLACVAPDLEGDLVRERYEARGEIKRLDGREVEPAAILGRHRGATRGEHQQDLVADLLRVGVETQEHASADTVAVAHQAEQQVLGADVVVAEAHRLAQRALEHRLG